MAGDREVLAGTREDMLLDDVGKQLEAQAAKDKKEKEDLEAAERAKAAREAAGQSPEAARIAALENALRISEEARQRQAALPGAASTPKPEPKPKLTREQLKELQEKDPLAAVEYLIEGSTELILENIDRRISPLVSGGAEAQKAAARQRFPDEFELFGDQIENMLKDPRLDPKAMSQPKAWDDLIAFIRGQNFAKLQDHYATKRRDDDAKRAQQAAADTAGAHAGGPGARRAPAPESQTDLDAIEKQIALGLFPHLDEATAFKEYKTWKGVTAR